MRVHDLFRDRIAGEERGIENDSEEGPGQESKKDDEKEIISAMDFYDPLPTISTTKKNLRGFVFREAFCGLQCIILQRGFSY